MPLSPGVKHEQEMEEPKSPQSLNADQKKSQSFYFKRLIDARTDRETARREFDGMTYTQDYQANLDAANTYLTPKTNDDDVRINTATSEKKIEAMQNELLSMNIQAEVHAFDQFDQEAVGLGKDFEHITFRTNQIEKEDDMWADMVRELITQRAVFVQEQCVSRKVKNSSYIIHRAQKVLISGTKVYLGNIKLPSYRFNEQPYIFTVETYDMDYARSVFGTNKNWDKIKAGGRASVAVPTTEETLYDFRISSLQNNEVEVINYYSYPDNEHVQWVNGVMMTEPGNPLPYNYEGYNIVMVTIKTIRTEFAYGKPPIASAKTLQALENETIRNLIRKFRQALEPPMGTSSPQIFSRDIWSAGAITSGVNKNMFEKLVDHQGVTSSEMSMFDLINKMTTEFVGVSSLVQGIGDSKEKTATQTLEELKQAIKMMGLAVFALMRLRRDLTLLRIFTIIEEFTKPMGKYVLPGTDEMVDRFQEFTVDNADLDGGQRGKKIVKFVDFDLSEEDEQAIFDVEEREAKRGNLVRIKTVNVKKLQSIPLFWFVAATEKERAGSAINKILFREKVDQAASIQAMSQGQVQVNWPNVAQSLSLVWADQDLFQKSAPTNLTNPNQPVQANENQAQGEELLGKLDALKGGTGIGAQLSEAPRSMTRMPSTNEMVRQG